MAELIVARVLEVSDHPGSRAPSYLLRIEQPEGGVEQGTIVA